jgi:adenosylcobinamide-GDP ribazoletransferase
MSWLAREWAVLLLALQFLTRLPMPRNLGYTPERLAAAPRYYPVVGALVGAIGAAAFWLADSLFPSPVAVVLSMAATLLATGAFHEDGLADMADGIGGGATAERALDIMKDSRIGTYGACALIGALMLKAAALISLPAPFVPMVLIAGHALSRCSSVVAIVTSRYVRTEGTGKPVAAGVSAGGLAVALAISAGIAAFFMLAASWQAGACALFGLGLGHVAARAAFERKLGGYTGDCLGAVQQTSELGFYLGALAWLSS